MEVVILAAGRGSRMGHLTHDQPKCFTRYKGERLIDRQIRILKEVGLDKPIIITGYKNKLIEGLHHRTIHNSNWASTNMVASLFCADRILSTSDVIVIYADIFFEKTAILELVNKINKFSIVYDPNWLELWEKRFYDPLSDGEDFRINQHNIITKIGGRIENLSEVNGQFMGIVYFTPDVWKIVKDIKSQLAHKDFNALDTTTLLSTLIREHKVILNGHKYVGVWGEIDSQNDLEIYQQIS